MRPFCVALLWAAFAFLTADGLNAAVTYRVTTRVEGGFGGRETFTVVADGRGIRASLTSRDSEGPIVHDGLIKAREGRVIALNSTNRTWYFLDDHPFAPSPMFLNPLPGATVRNVKPTFTDHGVTGDQHRYTGRIAYELVSSFGGVRVKVLCSATYEITTNESTTRQWWLGGVLPVTGLSAVDAELTRADLSIRGFPIRVSVVATRQYEGGPVMHQTTTVVTTPIASTASDGLLLDVPGDYVEQRPILGAPGSSPQ